MKSLFLCALFHISVTLSFAQSWMIGVRFSVGVEIYLQRRPVTGVPPSLLSRRYLALSLGVNLSKSATDRLPHI
jgi:hypothetical protein